MKLFKNININNWDEKLEQKILTFWGNRTTSFEKKSETLFTGKRGSIIGNLFSFKMQKLITKVTIINELNKVARCEIEINTIGQFITKWNKEFWQLELKTFESVLLENDYKVIEWENYHSSSRKKDILWVLKISAIIVLIMTLISFVGRLIQIFYASNP